MNPRLLVGLLLVLAGAGLGIVSAFTMGAPELSAFIPLFLSAYPVSLGLVLLGLWQVGQSEDSSS